MIIGKEYTFAAAHQLWDVNITDKANLDLFGKCSRPHGHNYVLQVSVEGTVNVHDGMVLNYYELDEVVQTLIIDKVDHRDLNDVFPHVLPTAENLVSEFWDMLFIAFNKNGREVALWEVIVKETARSYAKLNRMMMV